MKKSRSEYSQSFFLEKSKSRSGKHAFASMVLIINKNDNTIRDVIKAPNAHSTHVYSKGQGGLVNVDYGEDDVVVYLSFVQVPHKNPKRRLKGVCVVFDKGNPVYRAVYRELKVRGSMGDPSYFKYVKKALDYLNIPIKRANPDAHLPGSGN